MKTKQELEKLIPNTQHKSKNIFFKIDSRIRQGCLKELGEQKKVICNYVSMYVYA